MKTIAVVGGSFGDEGKGRVVDALTRLYPMGSVNVIRPTGGPQCGHRVVAGETKHIFSHFGSGTLAGAPTKWEAAVNPSAFLNEWRILNKKGVTPEIEIDDECPVILPADITQTRTNAFYVTHGTTGTGVGAAWTRHEDDHYDLRFKDIMSKTYVKRKIKNIMDCYYPGQSITQFNIHWLDNFLADWEEVYAYSQASGVHQNPGTEILEMGQGLLLDPVIGYFPNVTRMPTGISGNNFDHPFPNEVYYVYRSYSTRHGAGPFDEVDLGIKPTHDTDSFQGPFRIGPHRDDVFLAMKRDLDAAMPDQFRKVNIVITCLDHSEGKVYLQMDGEKKASVIDPYDFVNYFQQLGIEISNVYGSFDEQGKMVEL